MRLRVAKICSPVNKPTRMHKPKIVWPRGGLSNRGLLYCSKSVPPDYIQKRGKPEHFAHCTLLSQKLHCCRDSIAMSTN